MDTQIVVVFCLYDDMLKALQHHKDVKRQMTDAEVMTTAIVAMLYFKGNFRLVSQYLCEHRYIPNRLSRSRFNRRLHRIADCRDCQHGFRNTYYEDNARQRHLQEIKDRTNAARKAARKFVYQYLFKPFLQFPSSQ